MYPCKKCLENNWKFKKEDDGTITAICNNCGYQVSFPARGNKQTLKVGSPCRKCGHSLILKESKQKPKQLKKSYYFTAYYYCEKCRTMYFSPKFKVINKSEERNQELLNNL